MIYLKPLQRTIKRGMHGRDVLASKYALKHAGLGPHIVLNDTAGSAWERAMKNFQKRKGLSQTGTLNDQTWHALKYHVATTPYSTWLWNHFTLVKPDKRKAIVDAALYGAQHEPSIHYTQSSLRMYGVRNKVKPPGIPRYEDCSSFATWCYWLAGAADPNGRGYDGQGYTGTLAAHGKRVSLSGARPGDLVFYGGGFPYTHVAIYIGGGKVVSHGSEHGPIVCAAAYRPISTIRSYLP